MATGAPDLFGIRSATSPPREFLAKGQWQAENLSHTNPGSLVLAIFVIAVIWLWPRFGFTRIPGSIVAMLAATILLFALSTFDHERFGVATLASKFGPQAIPQGFPPLRWPIVNWAQIRDLLQPATAIALLGAIESLLSAVVADGLTNDRHDSNTELIAQGISNMVCPFLWRTAGDRSYRAEVSEHQQRRQISGFWDRSQPDSFGNRVGLCRMGGKRADLGYVGRAVQPLDMLRKAGFIDVIGRENLCAHFDAALNRAKSLVQPTG